MTQTSRWFFSLSLACVVTFCAGLAWAQGEGKTLREVLAAEQVPLDADKLRNLDKRITSGAELRDASQFVIAYYLHDATERLNPPMFIDVYDRRTRQWNSGSIESAVAKWRGLEVGCLGSVMEVRAFSNSLLLDTHLSPSAGCVLILSRDLKLRASLCGWVVGQLGENEIVYELSQVHFAPVHPAEIALYDLRTRRDVTLFPRKPDSAIRRARIAQLAEFYKANKEWCKENDDPCDPENFDSALQEEVATNEAEAAIAFLISYEQIQLVAGDVQKPSGPKDVLYVYRRVDDEAKMEYREMPLEDAKARFGTAKLPDFVQAEILQKIFAEAAAK
jgi:hypothetical protein